MLINRTRYNIFYLDKIYFSTKQFSHRHDVFVLDYTLVNFVLSRMWNATSAYILQRIQQNTKHM